MYLLPGAQTRPLTYLRITSLRAKAMLRWRWPEQRV